MAFQFMSSLFSLKTLKVMAYEPLHGISLTQLFLEKTISEVQGYCMEFLSTNCFLTDQLLKCKAIAWNFSLNQSFLDRSISEVQGLLLQTLVKFVFLEYTNLSYKNRITISLNIKLSISTLKSLGKLFSM